MATVTSAASRDEIADEIADQIANQIIVQIGEEAGSIWHLLYEAGPLPMTKLIKDSGAPRDLVMQAIGWLAREGKLIIEEEGRKKVVSLVEP